MQTINCAICGRELKSYKWTMNDKNDLVRACLDCSLCREIEIKNTLMIPELFRDAEIKHLSKTLQGKINSLPPDRGLLLWGEAGIGKSYAMAAIMKELIRKNPNTKIIRIAYEMICLKLRDTYKQGSKKTELDIIEPLIDVDKLFIEDVGTTVSVGQQESDFSLRTFLVLLDSRLEQCKQTFITTNKSVEELSKSFDSRIAGRLKQMCEVICLKGKDKRS